VQFSDEDLIAETRAGSHVAFEQLIRRYEKLVYRIAYSYARQPASALDISQDVFVKAFQKLEQYRGSGSFKGWLLRLAHNESANWVRGQRRYQDHDELTADNSPPSQPVQESELLAREQRRLLFAELRRLNPRQRLAVSLRYFERTPVREIAAMLECSEGVAKNILFRSLEKLRNRMALKWSENHEGLS